MIKRYDNFFVALNFFIFKWNKFRFIPSVKGILRSLRWTFLIIILLAAILLSRIFVWDHFKVPSGSMQPTIEPGDVILVNKQVVGPRLLNLRKLYRENRVEYRRLQGRKAVSRGDILVFQQPQWTANPAKSAYGEYFVKRCVGLPGDTLLVDSSYIRHCSEEPCLSMKRMFTSKKREFHDMYKSQGVYPHHPKYNHWSIIQFGPIWLPAKGSVLVFDTLNPFLYADIIRMEGNKFVPDSLGKVWINNSIRSDYTFKQNYYFMLGDNFFGSSDSRVWGFVPESHIVGKAFIAAFSINPYRRWYKSITWNRFFLSLNN